MSNCVSLNRPVASGGGHAPLTKSFGPPTKLAPPGPQFLYFLTGHRLVHSPEAYM